MAWSTVAELAGPQLDDALETCGRSLGADRADIRGQRLIEVVTWQFALPAAHGLLDDEPLPMIARVWIGDDSPEPTVDRHHASLSAWRDDLDDQLDPLVRAVNTATRRPLAALRRGANDRIAGAIVWVGQTTGREARAGELARGLGAEVRTFDAGSYEQVLHVREGCCLYYRIPGTAKCWSCPLLTDDDRRALAASG